LKEERRRARSIVRIGTSQLSDWEWSIEMVSTWWTWRWCWLDQVLYNDGCK